MPTPITTTQTIFQQFEIGYNTDTIVHQNRDQLTDFTQLDKLDAKDADVIAAIAYMNSPKDGLTQGREVSATGADGNTYPGLIGTGLFRNLLKDSKGALVSYQGVFVYEKEVPSEYQTDFNKPSYTSSTGDPVGGALSVEIFSTWPSAFQIEYLQKQTPAGQATLATVRAGSTSVGSVHVLYLPESKTVVYVERMGKSAISRLSTADQKLVADSEAYAALATTIGLVNLGSSANNKNALEAILKDAEDFIVGLVTGSNQFGPIELNNLTRNERKVFLDEINIFREHIGHNYIYVRDTIAKPITDLLDRFKRVRAFYADNVLTDPSITAAGKNFIQYEIAILAAITSSTALVDNKFVGDEGKLDLSAAMIELITLEQAKLDYYNKGLALELDQYNFVTKMYADAQQAISTLVASFSYGSGSTENAGNKDEQKNITSVLTSHGGTIDPTGNIKYFRKGATDGAGDHTGEKHPIEILLRLQRPLINEGMKGKHYFDGISSTLNSLTTQLSQQSNIKSNESSSNEKKKASALDGISSLLSKTTEDMKKIINGFV